MFKPRATVLGDACFGVVLELNVSSRVRVGSLRPFFEVFSDISSRMDLCFSMLEAAHFLELRGFVALDIAQPDAWVWVETATWATPVFSQLLTLLPLANQARSAIRPYPVMIVDGVFSHPRAKQTANYAEIICLLLRLCTPELEAKKKTANHPYKKGRLTPQTIPLKTLKKQISHLVRTDTSNWTFTVVEALKDDTMNHATALSILVGLSGEFNCYPDDLMLDVQAMDQDPDPIHSSADPREETKFGGQDLSAPLVRKPLAKRQNVMEDVSQYGRPYVKVDGRIELFPW